MILEYNPEEGATLSDATCIYLADQLVKDHEDDSGYAFVFSNERFLHEVILRIVSGRIDSKSIEFVINNKKAEIDELGFFIGGIELPWGSMCRKLHAERFKKLEVSI